MYRIALSLFLFILPSSVLADTINLSEQYQGRVRYVLVGASLVDNHGLDNGVNCLLTEASASITDEDIPRGSTLLSATLYTGGSLVGDDGTDYDPDTEIFSTFGLIADNATDREAVEDAARLAADKSVIFTPPGAPNGILLNSEQTPSVAVYYKPAGLEQGNVGFFVTSYDITDTLINQGQSLLVGDYSVSDFRADICWGREAVCDNPSDPQTNTTCGDISGIHTNGAASFALLLVLEDNNQPLRNISVFDGLLSLSGRTTTLWLEGITPISSPASGSLAFYAIEGDMTLGGPIPGQTPCAGEEFIEVDGDANPDADGLCLVDDDNPLGNIFNSTINVQDATSEPPTCERAIEEQCCQGDGVCPVTGVDIDRFDISDALVPGSTDIRVSVGSEAADIDDRVALSLLVVGVELFEPLLEVDSQIRVQGVSDNKLRIGQEYQLSVALSNTGNVPANNVAVQMSFPSAATELRLISTPSGSDADAALGATPPTLRVSNLNIPAGAVAGIELVFTPSCEADALQFEANVSADEILAFTIQSPQYIVGGPGVYKCDGIDPQGPFLPPTDERRVLSGGGGCTLLTPVWGFAFLFPIFLIQRQRRRSGRI